MDRTLSSWVARFLDDLSNTRRCSPHTVTAYRHDLQNLMTSQRMGDKMPGERLLTARCFQHHLAGQAAKGLSNRSLARSAASIRSFLQFLHRRGATKNDLSERVPSIKFSPALPQFLSERQMQRWLESLPAGDRWELRDRCLVILPYATGARLAEIVGLNWRDVDTSSATVRLFGKRQRERLAPGGRFLVESLEALRSKSPIAALAADQPIFVNRKGTRLTPRSVARIIQRTFARSVGGHVTPHRLRHSFATHMLDHGADLMALKELLGHENVATTQIYTHVTPGRLADVYHNAFPG